jgi:hypothetical protein
MRLFEVPNLQYELSRKISAEVGVHSTAVQILQKSLAEWQCHVSLLADDLPQSSYAVCAIATGSSTCHLAVQLPVGRLSWQLNCQVAG